MKSELMTLLELVIRLIINTNIILLVTTILSRHQMDPSTTFVRDDRFRIVLNKARDP